MGLKKFQIVFDSPWASYYSGQPVTGRIIVAVDSQKKIRALTVQIKGEAATKWDVTDTKKDDQGNNVQETTVYTGSETYFENKFNILGGGGNEIFIEAGEQSYPFQTYLPPNLPSSFEGEFGYVRYTVKATLDRPWKFDQDVKAAFTVVSPLDLNTHDSAKNPVKLEKEKFFCCCCCKSGPLTLVLSLPVGGYVPGQAIPVTVELDNNSNVNVSNVNCDLRKMLVFKAKDPTASSKKDKITIAEHKFGAVPTNSSKTWTEHIVIPPLPPSNLQNCNIIDLDYDLKIEAKLPGIYPNIELKLPIVLGTVPLLNYQPPPPPVVKEPAEEGGGKAGGDDIGMTTGSGWNPVPQQDPSPAEGSGLGAGDGPSAPPPGGYPQWGPPPAAGAQWGAPSPQEGPGAQPEPVAGGNLYPTIAPPSFAESTFGPKNIKDAGDNQYTQGDLQFAPRYPVYNYQAPRAPNQQ